MGKNELGRPESYFWYWFLLLLLLRRFFKLLLISLTSFFLETVRRSKMDFGIFLPAGENYKWTSPAQFFANKPLFFIVNNFVRASNFKKVVFSRRKIIFSNWIFQQPSACHWLQWVLSDEITQQFLFYFLFFFLSYFILFFIGLTDSSLHTLGVSRGDPYRRSDTRISWCFQYVWQRKPRLHLVDQYEGNAQGRTTLLYLTHFGRVSFFENF